MTTAINPQDGRTVEPLLNIENLKIAFESTTGVVEAVRDFDLTIYPGQSVAIVGESGSGKSTAAMSVLGLLPANGRVTDGSITFDGKDLTGLDEKGWQEVRGSQIGLVPQDPMSNLNPVWRIGTQVEESLKANNVVPGSERHQRVVEVAIGQLEFLDRLGIVAFDHGDLDPRQEGRGEFRRRIAQRDHLERSAHLGDLLHRFGVERRDPHAAAGDRDDEMLRLQLPEGLAHRDVAGMEFPRDMVLPERGIGRQRAADDALSEHLGNAPGGRRVLAFVHHRLSIIKTSALPHGLS